MQSRPYPLVVGDDDKTGTAKPTAFPPTEPDHWDNLSSYDLCIVDRPPQTSWIPYGAVRLANENAPRPTSRPLNLRFDTAHPTMRFVSTLDGQRVGLPPPHDAGSRTKGNAPLPTGQPK